ncbi:MAG: DegT/DnrJ/EryC1/StrS family aminotransferase [bacterium]
MKLPQIDLIRQYTHLKPEIDAAIGEVLQSGQFIMGKWVAELEGRVAEICGAKHAIGVASGTDALKIALFACGLRHGDEVITSPFSFVSVAEVAVLLGAKPVFVDIDKRTFNIDPDLLKSKITSRTKAVVPVHLYGQSADMDPIMEIARQKSLFVIEDAAQAIGAKYKGKPVGSIGDIGCLSFYPTKNLGCYGDGGMILTNDDSMAKNIESLRRHGQSDKYSYRLVGFNSRLDSIQAAIMLAKIGHLEQWTQQRRRIARLYNKMLADLPLEVPYEAEYAYHVYHQYTIKTDRRDHLREFLSAKGIGTAIHYPMGLHMQEAYRALGYNHGDLPNCDQVSQQVLSLPMFPELRDDEISYVVEAIKGFFEGEDN